MNWRSTVWLVGVTLALGAFIVFLERPARLIRTGTAEAPRLLPEFDPSALRSLEVRSAPGGTLKLIRTNGLWRLAGPEGPPAQQNLVADVLHRVATLQGPSVLTPAELRARPQATSEFGLNPPAVTVRLDSRAAPLELRLGSRSINLAQVYFQVTGLPGIFAADAGLADLLSTDPGAWREKALVPLDRLVFDRLRVDAQGAAFTLSRGATNGPWEIVEPRPARADPARVGLLFHQLGALQILRFLAPTSAPPLETAGLRPPRLIVSLGRGTNEVFNLALGAGVTNAAAIYAKRGSEDDVLNVRSNALELLRISYKDLLDRRILRFDPESLREIDIEGPTRFRLVRGAEGWRLLPQDVAADPLLVQRALRTLASLEILDIAKEVVTDLDLSNYGLAPPAGRITLRTSPGDTNAIAATLETGTLVENRVFARVLREQPVYLLSPADLGALPSQPWQLRDRSPWRFTAPEVASITIRQAGLDTLIHRLGTNEWAMPPGLRNEINPFALEESLHRFGEVRALTWIAEGDTRARALGIGAGPELLFELRGHPSTNQLRVAFGKRSPAGHRYAASTFTDGARLTFELPGIVCDDLWRELGIGEGPVAP